MSYRTCNFIISIMQGKYVNGTNRRTRKLSVHRSCKKFMMFIFFRWDELKCLNGFQQVDAPRQSLQETAGLQSSGHQVSRVQKTHHPGHQGTGQTSHFDFWQTEYPEQSCLSVNLLQRRIYCQFVVLLSGKVHLDFKSPAALAALTKTLLLGLRKREQFIYRGKYLWPRLVFFSPLKMVPNVLIGWLVLCALDQRIWIFGGFICAILFDPLLFNVTGT